MTKGRVPPTSITQLLEAVREGAHGADEALIDAVYEEFRKIARSVLGRAGRDATLQPTALVHEAYLHLRRDEQHDWKNRRYFFAAAARAMRHIVVDEARRKQSRKRGGGWTRVDFSVAEREAEGATVDIIALERALHQLEASDARAAKVVELRYFVGLSGREIGHVMSLSERTIERSWAYARAFLYRALHGQPEVGAGGA